MAAEICQSLLVEVHGIDLDTNIVKLICKLYFPVFSMLENSITKVPESIHTEHGISGVLAS